MQPQESPDGEDRNKTDLEPETDGDRREYFLFGDMLLQTTFQILLHKNYFTKKPTILNKPKVKS